MKITEGAFINLVDGYYYVNAGCTIEDFIGAITDLPAIGNGWNIKEPLTAVKASDNTIYSFIRYNGSSITQGLIGMVGSQLRITSNGLVTEAFTNKKIYILHK